MKNTIKATITEQGNGLPSIGELCYDPETDTVYQITAWDGGGSINTHGGGCGNSIDVVLKAWGNACDTSEDEWEAIEDSNYRVTIDA